MRPVIVLAGSKLLASALSAGISRLGCEVQGYGIAAAALEACRQLQAGVFVLYPIFGRRIELGPARELAEASPTTRLVLLVDEEIEAVGDATIDLPPHCRVSLDSGIEGLNASIRDGRSRTWGRARGGGLESLPRQRGGSVVLPDGIVLTVAEGEVLLMACRGRSASQIAASRGVSRRTIETQMRCIRRKTGATPNAVLLLQYAAWASEPRSDDEPPAK